MTNKLNAAGLFAIALGLFAVAWAIHDHTERHSRYTIEFPFRFDTLTGDIESCKAIAAGMGECEPWTIDAAVDSLGVEN